MGQSSNLGKPNIFLWGKVITLGNHIYIYIYIFMGQTYNLVKPNQGPGTRDQGPGTGTRDQGPGTRDQGPGTRDQGPGTRDQGPGPGPVPGPL